MIRVVLPAHLQALAHVSREVTVDVDPPVTTRRVLDAVESAYPTLAGTIRNPTSGQRRPFVRFFVGQEDLSHDGADTPLPGAVASGDEPFIVVGAMAGG